jgi:hypothetical protein
MTRIVAIALLTLLTTAATAGECTIDGLRQAIDAWDRTEDAGARQTIAQGLEKCLDERGIPRIVTTEREPGDVILCASCGMKPTLDPATRIWRPYRQ